MTSTDITCIVNTCYCGELRVEEEGLIQHDLSPRYY